jgi:enamine deaminase RidA (YjgF/YER057c/UK114 family)
VANLSVSLCVCLSSSQSGVVVEGGVEAQTEQALTNLSAVLEAGGSSLANVLKVSTNRQGPEETREGGKEGALSSSFSHALARNQPA